MTTVGRWIWALAALALVTGCVKPEGPSTGGEPSPQRPARALPQAGEPLRFWHTQTQENQTALEAIVAEFNRDHPDGPPIEATYIGNYDQLYEKIKTSAAETTKWVLPDLAVAYESMIADYMQAEIVRPLDDLVNDPTVGLSAEDLADIHPAYLETNRFPQFGGKLLSFPFTKSNLMLYYNESMLDEVGLKPPKTWDEFIAACRAIKKKRGIRPYANSVDASALDGMILSFGGALLDERGGAGFDQPAATEALKVLDTLFKRNDELAYQVVDKGDQNNDFANQKCAFFLRSSTARPFVQKLVGNKFKWNMTGLPSGPGVKPLTVMFGANICIFRSTPERERKAWEFIKYFTSTPITTRWAVVTGYLPVRKSAAETEEMKSFFAAAPQNRAAFDLLAVAVPEPNVAGWQAVRKCLEEAETAIINQMDVPETIVVTLDGCADAELAKAGTLK